MKIADHCKGCKKGGGGLFNMTLNGKYNINRMMTNCVRSQIRDYYEEGVSLLGYNNGIGFENGYINVAVHIRRGDVVGVHKDEWHGRLRYLSLERTGEMMNFIEEKYSGKAKIFFNIFSEGRPSDFQALLENRKNARLQLLGQRGMMRTFHAFTRADVLIIGLSSFSYVAALLNGGTEIYYPLREWNLFFRPLREWHGI